MKNRTIIFMFFAAVAVMLMLAAAAQAQTCQDCSASELEIGTCTPLTYLNGSPTGYVLRLLHGYPLFDGTNTEAKYEVCLKDGYNPHALSHADLESRICNETGCTAVAAYANDIETGYTQIAAGTGGDPSSGYGDDLPSDLVKINLPTGFQNGTFSLKVAGTGFATLGNIGFKAGQDIMAGSILLLVCSDDCPLVTYAAFQSQTVKIETGEEFDLVCNGSTGCCEVTACRYADGSSRPCTMIPMNEFLGVNKDGGSFEVESISSDGKCLNLFIDDTSAHSTGYCSGGVCWY